MASSARDSNTGGWTALRRRLGLLLLITDDEWRTLPAFVVADALLVAGVVFGLSASNSIFTRRIGADALPWAFILSAAVMLVVTPAISRAVHALSRRHALWLIHGGFGLVLAGVYFVLGEDWAVWAFFVAAAVAGYASMLPLWTIATEVYDPRQAKRLFPLIGAGGSIGAIAAGLVAPLLTAPLGAEILAVAWSFCLLAVAVLFEGASVYRPRVAAPVGSGGSFLDIPVAVPLVAITALTVLVSWLIDFQFNVILLRQCANEADFANYYAWVSGAVSLVSLVVQLGLAGRLMTRLGVVGTMAAPPALMLVPAGAMALSLNIVLVTCARFLDQLFQITLLAAAGDTVLSAIPPARRDAVITTLRLVVSPLAMGLAGALLLAFRNEPALARALIPALLLAWLLVVGTLRRRYLDTLMHNLSSPDESARLASLSALESLTDDAVAHLLRESLASGRQDLVVFALQMIREPGMRHLGPQVAERLGDASPLVRREAAETLAVVAPREAFEALWRLLDDEDAAVRRQAADALGRLAATESGWSESFLGEIPERAARESDAEARAAMLRSLGDLGWSPDQVVKALEALAEQPARNGSVHGNAAAAASALPVPLPDEARELAWRFLFDAALEVRRRAASRLRGPFDPATYAALLRLLRDPETSEEAGRALATSRATGVMLLRHALSVENAETRARICQVIGEIGSPDAADVLLGALSDSAAGVRYAAVRAIARLRVPGGVGSLDAALEQVAARLVALAARVRVLEGLDNPRALLIRDELGRELGLARESLLAVISLAAGAEVARSARGLLQGGGEERARGISLEVVDTALGGGAREAVLQVLERPAELATLPLGEGPRFLALDPQELLLLLSQSDDPWLARCAGWVLEPSPEGVTEMLTMMEKVLFLRQVDLFRDLAGRDLAVIAESAQEVAFPKGQVIFEEGWPGDALFLITRGSVAVQKGVRDARRVVAVLGERECFGEMAILTGELRSATVEAAEEVRALLISRQTFRELVVHYPHIAFPIFEILARRLKDTTERYHEQTLRG